MPTCIPLRVDHLDFNNEAAHSVAPLLRDEDTDSVFVFYHCEQTDGPASNDHGVYVRVYDAANNTLGSAVGVATDNTGAGRTTPGSVKENKYPHAVRLNNGTLICAYNGNGAGTRGMFVRESTDDGATWSAEFELTHPGSLSIDNGIFRTLATDGVDVFALTVAASGTEGGDLQLRMRNGVADWDAAWTIWTNPRLGSEEGWEFGGEINGNGGSPVQAMKVKNNGDGTWTIAIVTQHKDVTDPSYIISCYESSDFNNLSAGTWAEHTIHDFGTDAQTRNTILEIGTDEVLRVCYWNVETYDGRANWDTLYVAYSSDWGVTWTDLGKPVIPNDVQQTGRTTWDPTYDASFTLDYSDAWRPTSIITGAIAADEYWYRFRSESDTLGGFSLNGFCILDDATTDFNTPATGGSGGSIAISTYLVRLCESSDAGVFKLWFLRVGDLPPPPEEEEVPFPVTNRIWRRGIIQAVRTDVPQRHNIAAAPIERLDKPGSF